jgi:hypothetical protein
MPIVRVAVLSTGPPTSRASRAFDHCGGRDDRETDVDEQGGTDRDRYVERSRDGAPRTATLLGGQEACGPAARAPAGVRPLGRSPRR